MLRPLLWFAVLAAVSACGTGAGSEDSDAGSEPADASPFPPPDDEVVPEIGSAQTLEIASWNIENFPRAQATPKMVADLIASMNIDIVAVQEIESNEGWDELIARLPDHDGVLSSHTYGNGNFQKIGFIYRRELVTLEAGLLLFDDDSFEFPRPPLQVIATIDDGVNPPLEMVLITLHLKAGRDAEDRARRDAALITLEEHVRTSATALDSDVVILGDYNEVVTSSGGREVFNPFLEAPSLYTLETETLAQSGAFTFVPSGAVLDHVITTSSLADERAEGEIVIPLLHQLYAPYNGSVSDHLPVIVTLPLQQ